jgi:hypothetical protein
MFHTKGEAQAVLQQCYTAWTETPGAIAMIEAVGIEGSGRSRSGEVAPVHEQRLIETNLNAIQYDTMHMRADHAEDLD